MTGEDSASRRRFLQTRGADVAKEYDVDVDILAYHVAGNLHSAFTQWKAVVERGPLREAGLSLTAFIALWSIWVHGEMEGREVADEIGIARSSFSELAKRLEQRGLLDRSDDPTDGRVALFGVTAEGSALVKETWPKMNAYIQRLTATLNEGQRVQLVDHLKEVVNQLERVADEEI